MFLISLDFFFLLPLRVGWSESFIDFEPPYFCFPTLAFSFLLGYVVSSRSHVYFSSANCHTVFLSSFHDGSIQTLIQRQWNSPGVRPESVLASSVELLCGKKQFLRAPIADLCLQTLS